MDLLSSNDRDGEYPPSYYAATARQLEKQHAAKGQHHTDVCVIGAGFSGLSAALHLAKQGYKVSVLDAQRIGFGASGRNGGQVGKGQRLEQDELEDLLGKQHARGLWDISQDAVALVKDICAQDADCAFTPGIIHAAHKKRYVAHEHAYVEKLATDYDYSSFRALDQTELRTLVNSDKYYGGSLDLNAGHVHPLSYAFALARLCLQHGVTLFEETRVTQIKHGQTVEILTDQATITADYAVLACNGYLGALDKSVAKRVMPICNYIVATEPLSDSQMNAVVKNYYAVADTKFVVNYFRFAADNRLLFGGTESYGYKFPENIADKVRKPLESIFPQLKGVVIDYAWGGTLGITMNRMPHFARVTGNVLSISGYSGHGVAMATMGGKMAAEAIMGQAERFDLMAKVPSPKFPGGVTFRSPLLACAMMWYSLRDKL